MTEKRDSTTAPTGQDHRRSERFAFEALELGVATGAVLAVSLLAACGGDSTEWDTLTVNQHLYLNGPDGTKFEISVGKDASGQDVVTATRIGE